jgi:hypothetical protein
MARQAEFSGMRDSLSINEEHIGSYSQLFRDSDQEGTFSEPKKTRNIPSKNTIHHGCTLNHPCVRGVPDGGSSKRNVPVIRYIHSAQESRLEVRVIDPLDA